MSDEITLRDTFAAAAMTGMMAHGHWPTHDGGAQDAWKAADAMLRARGDTPCTTLTDAEREALEWSIKECEREAVIEQSRATTGNYLDCALRECQAMARASTLRTLLARLGGAS